MNGAASDAATGFGTILGISIKGRFDFGILIEKVNFHRKILDSDLSGFGIGPVRDHTFDQSYFNCSLRGI